MSTAVDPNPEAVRPELTERGPGGQPGGFGFRGTTSLRVGVAALWLSVIVLLPLAAIVWQSAKGGWSAFLAAVTSPAAIDSFRVTLTNGHSVLATLGGNMRRFRIRVLQGDRVTVEVSPYDLTRGRITFRHKI